MIITILLITEGENGLVNAELDVKRDNATKNEEALLNEIAAACRKIARKGKGGYEEERRS